MRATTVMASPITNALSTLWVEDGTAEAMLQAVLNESNARQALASKHLAVHGVQPEAVRICLGGPMTRDECDHALRLIAETLAHPLHPHATVM